DTGIRLCDEIPVAHTPPGGYCAEMPAPILLGCGHDPVEGAPDLRGLWRPVAIEIDGQLAPAEHPARRLHQRIEQCGDRIVITAAGVIHDMRCDGTEGNGVNDVAEFDFETPITVVATYEHDVDVLRAVGLPIE